MLFRSRSRQLPAAWSLPFHMTSSLGRFTGQAGSPDSFAQIGVLPGEPFHPLGSGRNNPRKFPLAGGARSVHAGLFCSWSWPTPPDPSPPLDVGSPKWCNMPLATPARKRPINLRWWVSNPSKALPPVVGASGPDDGRVAPFTRSAITSTDQNFGN